MKIDAAKIKVGDILTVMAWLDRDGSGKATRDHSFFGDVLKVEGISLPFITVSWPGKQSYHICNHNIDTRYVELGMLEENYIQTVIPGYKAPVAVPPAPVAKVVDLNTVSGVETAIGQVLKAIGNASGNTSANSLESALGSLFDFTPVSIMDVMFGMSAPAVRKFLNKSNNMIYEYDCSTGKIYCYNPRTPDLKSPSVYSIPEFNGRIKDGGMVEIF